MPMVVVRLGRTLYTRSLVLSHIPTTPYVSAPNLETTSSATSQRRLSLTVPTKVSQTYCYFNYLCFFVVVSYLFTNRLHQSSDICLEVTLRSKIIISSKDENQFSISCISIRNQLYHRLRSQYVNCVLFLYFFFNLLCTLHTV